jgi:hypothetical protein
MKKAKKKIFAAIKLFGGLACCALGLHLAGVSLREFFPEIPKKSKKKKSH